MTRQAPRARLVSGSAGRPWGVTAKQANEGSKKDATKHPKRVALRVKNTRSKAGAACALCKKPIPEGPASWSLLGSGRTGVTHLGCAIAWNEPKLISQDLAPTKVPQSVPDSLGLKEPPANWTRMRADQRWLLMLAADPKLGLPAAARLLRSSHVETEWVMQTIRQILLLPKIPKGGPPSTRDLLRARRNLTHAFVPIAVFARNCGWPERRATMVADHLVRVGAVEHQMSLTGGRPVPYVRSTARG